jgi:hypothetical protein
MVTLTPQTGRVRVVIMKSPSFSGSMAQAMYTLGSPARWKAQLWTTGLRLWPRGWPMMP